MLSRIKHIIHQLNLCIMAGLIIALPFAVDRSLMFPTQNAKYFLFGFVMIGIVSIVLIEIFLTRKHVPLQIKQLDILLALFFLYSAIRVGIDVENFGVTKRFVELSGLAVLYLVLRRYESRSFEILLIALLLSGAAQAIYGNLQLYGIFPSHHSMFKITGGFFNPGPYAGFLAIIFPIALVTYLSNKSSNLPLSESLIEDSEEKGLIRFFHRLNITQRTILRYISLVTIISILLILPATRSRAAWLAVAASSLFVFAVRHNVKKYILGKLNTIAKRTAFVAALAILMATATMGLYAMKKGSADGRLLIWKVTSNMIAQQPVFGFGYDHFKANYLNYQADYFNRCDIKEEAAVADNSTRAFNEYLQLTSELGIVGIVMILVIAFIVFYGEVYPKAILWNQAVRMSIIAFGVFALFSYPTEILPIKVCLVVGLAMVSLQQQNYDIKFFEAIRLKKIFRPLTMMSSLIGLFVSIALFVSLKQQYSTIQLWKQAYMTYQMGAYEASISGYEEVYEQLKFNGDYLVNYGKACSMAGEHMKAVDILKRAKLHMPNTIVFTALGDSYKALGKPENMEKEYLRASQILPGRFYPKYLLAKFYDETGQQIKAVEMANQLLNKEIKVESMAVEEIKAEMQAIVDKSKLSSS